jgi:hypothetical protein
VLNLNMSPEDQAAGRGLPRLLHVKHLCLTTLSCNLPSACIALSLAEIVLFISSLFELPTFVVLTT